MKTPDEIKKGLGCCNMTQCPLLSCPYFNDEYCGESLNADALAYIKQLEEDRKERDILADAYQQLERERDAAIADLTAVCETVNTCLACDHYRPDWEKPGCELNGLHCAWKWRGAFSPSLAMRESGRHFAEGFAEGLRKAMEEEE